MKRKQKTPVVLASKSPRRQELLKLLGIDFSIELKDVDESYPEILAPADIAIYISEKKAAAFSSSPENAVITSDTIVALNGEIMGKPESKSQAVEMLQKLAGTTHSVFTGVSIAYKNKLTSFVDHTFVTCRSVSREEIENYIEQCQPFDKAGSYGIQDWWGLAVVEKLEGSYTNVMGLPTEKLYKKLVELAIL